MRNIRKLIPFTQHRQTRSQAVARMADRTGCQWSSRSSKVDDYHFIGKGVCHFLIVINSNIGRISRHFRDMTSFSLKKRTFSYPLVHSTSNLEMFFFALNGWNFACRSLTHMGNYLCKKFSFAIWSLATIHPWQTDGQTDERTDDNSYQ